MKTGEDKQLSLLGMAKSHEPAHLSSDTFWYIVTGRQSWSWCAARARTISWCRKPSLCCTALVRVLPSTESLPTCSKGSANAPVASSPKYSQIFLASSAMLVHEIRNSAPVRDPAANRVAHLPWPDMSPIISCRLGARGCSQCSPATMKGRACSKPPRKAGVLVSKGNGCQDPPA